MDYYFTSNTALTNPSQSGSSSSSSLMSNPNNYNGKVGNKKGNNKGGTGSGGGKRRNNYNNNGVKLSTDPQSVAARERRHRISHRFKILQSLVPGGTKMDIVSMLEEAINYVKFLKSQILLHKTLMNYVDHHNHHYHNFDPNSPFYFSNLNPDLSLLASYDPSYLEVIGHCSHEGGPSTSQPSIRGSSCEDM